MKELNLIKKISGLVSNGSYIGDDTAFLEELGIVVTTDALVEDVHFRLKTTSPYNLGYKAMAVNLSDIASDGAIPSYAFVTLSLPNYIEEDFVEEFYKGMRELCSKFGVIIAGGDITGAEKVFINIALIGKTNGLSPARRSNAKIGDVLLVSGFFGSSRAGLEILENEENYIGNFSEDILQKFKKAHLRPFPYLELGRKILEKSSQTPAMIDSSDGLADALFKIAQASKVQISVEENLIPKEENFIKIAGENAFNWALFGGEDYTLVASMEENAAQEIVSQNPTVKIIGRVVGEEEKGLVKIIKKDEIFEINEETLEKKAFSHF